MQIRPEGKLYVIRYLIPQTHGVTYHLPCREGRPGVQGKEKATNDRRVIVHISMNSNADELSGTELAF